MYLPRRQTTGHHGFSLIELLVVVAIIAILIGLLLPAVGRARQQSNVVRVHVDLRQVCLALDAYALESRDELPPTRLGCSQTTECQLPIELAIGGYLFPTRPDQRIPQAFFPDLFNPNHTYKYRAPGPVWYNGTYCDFPRQPWRPRSWAWVPTDFPTCRDSVMTAERNRFGAFPDEDPPCPLKYAVWSTGPDPASPKFPRFEASDEIDESRLPLPEAYWLKHAGDTGVITHFTSTTGHTYTSP